jgi:S-adenosylmethionine decarboxylase
MKVLGTHYLIELSECTGRAIDELGVLRLLMIAAARAAGATIVNDVFHRFNPHGLSGVVVISESHLAVHTWPEHACASVDLFTCSPALDVEAMLAVLKAGLGARHATVRRLERAVVAPQLSAPSPV